MSDAASTTRVSETVQRLLPALGEFNRFDGPDRAVPRSEWLDKIDEPLPERGVGADETLALIEDVVIRRGLRTGHPGFTGWVTTAPSDVGVAADLAQTVSAAQRWWVHPGNHIDSMAVEWMLQLIGFPDSFVGQFAAGGSSANLIGLGAARQHAGEKLGIDAARDGFTGIHGPTIYASEQAHHVVGRALGVLGFGRAAQRTVPLGGDGRIDVAALRGMLDTDIAAGHTPVAIVGNAGDVNTGKVDDLSALAELARDHDIWLHVDGAYGGFGILDERVRERYGDPADYDSFAIDPHKWLAAPVGTGLVVCRDGDLLGRSFTIETGGYDRERETKVEGDPPSPWESIGSGTPDWGLDFSTPARGIAVWAILKEIGAEGVRERVVRHNDCARLVARRAAAEPELDLMSEPELSIACFRYSDPDMTDSELDDLNQRILAELRRRGESIPSGTWLGERFALRPCFINPRSGIEDAGRLVDDVLEIGRALTV